MSCLTIFLRTTFKFLYLIALGNEILKIRLFLDMVFCIYWSKVEGKKDICFSWPIVCILPDILNGCIIGYSWPRFFQISMFWNLMANSKSLIYHFHVKLYGHSLKRCVWEKNLMSTDDGQGLSSVALWAYVVIKFSWLFNLFCISLNYFQFWINNI